VTDITDEVGDVEHPVSTNATAKANARAVSRRFMRLSPLLTRKTRRGDDDARCNAGATRHAECDVDAVESSARQSS
jgi:hypothetical protein